jgi:sucrose-6-phosphate hydrolase SacC (GH32 family)
MALTVFVDRSSLEVFADDGRAVLSVNIFPRPDSVKLAPFAEAGRARLRQLEIHRLADAIFAAASKQVP